MVNGLQRRRKRRRTPIQGRLGCEAGYSQAAPVTFWRYKLLAVTLTKKTQNRHAA